MLNYFCFLDDFNKWLLIWLLFKLVWLWIVKIIIKVVIVKLIIIVVSISVCGNGFVYLLVLFSIVVLLIVKWFDENKNRLIVYDNMVKLSIIGKVCVFNIKKILYVISMFMYDVYNIFIKYLFFVWVYW